MKYIVLALSLLSVSCGHAPVSPTPVVGECLAIPQNDNLSPSIYKVQAYDDSTNDITGWVWDGIKWNPITVKINPFSVQSYRTPCPQSL